MYPDKDLYKHIDKNNRISYYDFKDLVRKFSKSIWKFSYYLENKFIDAEDLYQEGLLLLYAVYCKDGDLPEANFGKLFLTILRRRLITKVKQLFNQKNTFITNEYFCDDNASWSLVTRNEKENDCEYSIDGMSCLSSDNWIMQNYFNSYYSLVTTTPLDNYTNTLEFGRLYNDILEMIDDDDVRKLFIFIVNNGDTTVPAINKEFGWEKWRSRIVLKNLRKVVKKYLMFRSLEEVV
jgi:hypothetical protein